jgi:uncharacterized protein (TIGR03000 family)
MSLQILRLGAAVVAAALFAAPTEARHPGGFHAGAFHAAGFHEGGFHAAAFHAGGFPAGAFHAGGFPAAAFHAPGFPAGAFHALGLPAGAFRAAGFHRSGFHAGGFRTGVLHLAGSHLGAWRRARGWRRRNNNLGAAYLGGLGGLGAPDGSFGDGMNADQPDDGDLSGDAPDLEVPGIPGAEMPQEGVPPGGPAAPTAPESDAPAGPATPTPDNKAQVTVVVPANAEVWFNGVRMHTTGGVREFDTPPLTPGQDYSYQVHARWTEGGRVIDRTRKVRVRANLQLKVDLTQPQPGDVNRGP